MSIAKHFTWGLVFFYALGCSDSASVNGETTGTGGAGGTGAAGGAGTGSAGASGGQGGGVTVEPSLCEIDLPKFENNGYRSCEPNDNAEVAGVCGAQFDGEHGRTEVCGKFRVYAYGHDGRIGCAHDSSTGDLAGGFLYGIPVLGMNCSSYVAGPAELAACPVPTIPFCDPANGEGGAGGNAAEGGAAGAL